jgi:hypothetical protein
MSSGDIIDLVVGAVQGLTLSAVFILVLFIGFCVLFGFTKLKPTAGGTARVIKSLDERVSLKPMSYLKPDAPRGPADQLRAPELTERRA